MILRISSPKGMQRLEVSEQDNYAMLMDMVASKLDLPVNGSWYLAHDRSDSKPLSNSRSICLSKLGLKHGDMIFLKDSEHSSSNFHQGSSDVQSNDLRTQNSSVVEDMIDQELAKVDGQIKRKRNEQLCHHPVLGRCIHCVPLEPFDAAYLEHLDPPVKFMSFHAYLRKLSGGQGKGKFVNLENLSCRVRPGCRDHPSWPDGICTKCQPNPVTLEIQPYRHVDYVQFENGQIIETYLDFWRHSGQQRIGILLGRYQHFDTVGAPPLAIKAVVTAIYEPLQESTTRSVRLTAPLDSLLPSHVLEVANRLDLRPVGWIFTDLVAEDQPNKGTVKHYRGTMDTFFLSAEECITAAHLQNLHPNICALSSDGRFGSKFVTVVVTGDASNEIHFEAYQVSNQAMALVRDNILIPTHDAPEFGYIRETTKEQFVPEVFYTLTDHYGNRVTRIARPLPVEYLLLDMPVAFPIEPLYSMAKIPTSIDRESRFPVENRESLGQIQDFAAFARTMHAFRSQPLFTCLANFHLLCWLAGNDSLPLSLRTTSDQDGLAGLLDAIVLASRPSATISAAHIAVNEWATRSAAWATVDELAMATSGDLTPLIPPRTHSSFEDQLNTNSGNVGTSVGLDPILSTSVSSVNANIASGTSTSDYWACQHCTYHNALDLMTCEMCGLPLGT